MLYWEFGIVFASEEFIFCFFPPSFSSTFVHMEDLVKKLHDSYMILSIFAYNNNNNHNNNKGGGGDKKKKREE